ncbi:MAG: chorismate mutase [Clostridiales bacterium]|nr:chorismate mutase [Clostridiales bacterium]
MSEKSERLYEEIKRCDREIAQLLKTRMHCIEEITEYRRDHGLPILTPEPERRAPEALDVEDSPFGQEILRVFQEIHESGKRVQAKTLFDHNIFLIGFMGAGKSTISAALSRQLSLELIEMDAYIQEKEGMTISRIFDIHGEEYFRSCESDTLAELGKKDHALVSCGGGVPMREKNVEIMKKNGYVVLLSASPEAIYERVKDNTDRPLLNGHMNVSYIEELMEKRRPKYEHAADLIVDTTGKEVQEICEELLRKLCALQSERERK